jgi:hypothetical protein
MRWPPSRGTMVFGEPIMIAQAKLGRLGIGQR